MENRYLGNSLAIISVLFLLALIYSCASIGTPNGGPYDETPPKFVSSIPTPNQLNYKDKKVEILFDELIQLEKPAENVIITPPQLQMPIIRAQGKKVVVELRDSLQDNTTYTIDFTNSIADNNEKNVLENFTFAFSTSDVIDSMEVSGVLLNAENLEPMPGITVGLHKNLEDSAFTKEPFLRTSRTNDRGRFTIRNIAPGTYRIYALNDVNRDYRFDQPGEDIAFYDSLIVPSFEPAQRQDTTWVDSLTIDTIKTIDYNRFTPDDIRMFLFKEKFERQYMRSRPERKEEHLVTLNFNASLDTIPVPIPLNFEPVDSNWYYLQTADQDKTINYWITDSTLWKQDTLRVELTYPRSDTLGILRLYTDTLPFIMRRRPAPKKKKKDEPEPTVFLEMSTTATGTVNLFDTMSVTFNEPLADISKDLFYLNIKEDTLWVPAEFDFRQDSINTLRYIFSRPWRYGEEYMLEADSATIFSVYGKWNDTFSNTFSIKKREDYGHIYLNVTGIDTTAFVELLDGSDQRVRRSEVKDGGALFMDLNPGKYYARLIVDLNNNGVWDTGNYGEKLQPEPVYYYPTVLEVMQNWEQEVSDWNILSLPQEKQKPMEVTKNKPKEATQKKRDYRDEGKRGSSSSSGNPGFGGGGLPF